MPIAYTDPKTGKTMIASVASGVAAELAATFMHLPAGSWRVVSDAEAEELQKPTPEELAAVRRAEILAELADIDRASIRALRSTTIDRAIAGDMDKLAALEFKAENLRAELAGLEGKCAK